jgi:hypothetical protein
VRGRRFVTAAALPRRRLRLVAVVLVAVVLVAARVLVAALFVTVVLEASGWETAAATFHALLVRLLASAAFNQPLAKGATAADIDGGARIVCRIWHSVVDINIMSG